MQAHGASVIKVGTTYYLIGEDKTFGAVFQNINCYSSVNLVEWGVRKCAALGKSIIAWGSRTESRYREAESHI